MKRIIALAAFTALTACTSVAPQTSVKDQLAYAYGAVAGLRNLALARINDNTMTFEEGVAVHTLANQVRTVLDTTRTMLYSNSSNVFTNISYAAALTSQLKSMTFQRASSGSKLQALAIIAESEANVHNVVTQANAQHGGLKDADFEGIVVLDNVARANLATKLNNQ